jgi:hypothetical protein
VVFGILPTLSDAKKFGKTLNELSLRLHQYRRDAGRHVRRGFNFELQQDVEVFGSESLEQILISAANTGTFGFDRNTNVIGSGSSNLGSIPTSAVSTELFMHKSRSVWFDGSFTYFIPEIPGFSGRLEKYLVEYDRMLGLQMDSNAAWQLSPWSWLVDWFFDISENLAAIEVAHDDNLVMNYGYAMERTICTAVAKTQFLPASLGTLGNSTLTTELRTETKRRVRANPYGFVKGSDESVWTPYRLAVLAALGISR